MPRPFDPERVHRPSGRYRRILSCVIGQKAKTQLCPDTPSLHGKLALVTGGTGGIGKEIAHGLLMRGADVIVAARRSADAFSGSGDSGPSDTGELWSVKLDLGSLASVRRAVETIAASQRGRRLDIVCANAGISPHGYSQSADGFESAFAVNCLGHHALIRGLQTHNLLSEAATVVGTTGDIYVLADACTPDFSYKGRGLQAYCRSKLGNLWQFGELARRYPALRVVSVHPGVVATDLEGPSTGLTGAVKRAMLLSPALGAQASLIAVTQDALSSGGYFHNVHGRIDLTATDPAADAGKAAAFWDQMEEICLPVLQS